MGGLGNQMFQYAYGVAMEHYGKVVKYDRSWLDFYGKKVELVNAFSIDFNNKYASKDDCERLGYCSYSLAGRILERLNVKKTFIYQRNPMEAITFEQNLVNVDNKYIAGYFQSEKYFASIKDEICKIYQFGKLNKQSMSINKRINSCEAVAIHVRRGDYVNNSLYEVCDEEYYKKAIDIMKKYFKKPIFFIFSNDILFCKKIFADENVVYVEGNAGEDSWQDMYLMTQCKGIIIPNSTFGWWGAWLNKNSNVVVPRRWFNMSEQSMDIIPDKWWRI